MSRVNAVVFAACSAFACLDVAAGNAAASLDFDKVFNDRGAPKQAHYAATYQLGPTEHRIEVWRDRELRLKRRTDDAIETVLAKRPGEVEWSMTVLDIKRRIRTDVDRTNLYRIGYFTDWFGLAHSLARPRGTYTLTTLPAAAVPRVVPLAACRWYALTQGSNTSKVCWSASQRIPLLITDSSDVVKWRVAAMDASPIASATFATNDRGFVRNDANRDIEAD